MIYYKTHKKKLTLASRLPSYKPLNVLLRVVTISLVAIGLLQLIVYFVSPPNAPKEPVPLRFYLIFIFAFLSTAEFLIALDNLLERLFPIPNKVRLRLTIQILMGLFALYVIFNLIFYVLDPEIMSEESRPGILMGVFSGLLFVSMLAHSLIIVRFTEKWSDSQKQISEMKRDKLEMDYNSLQDQINPHFLFNNLSVLKSLIIYNKDSAVKFTEDFTDVYRYVLQSKDKRLVSVKDEITFIDSYLGLHKERLGEGLQIKYSVSKEAVDLKIAPLTLQLLVENAIKHNTALKDAPLHISILAENEILEVKNNVQLRTTSYSTKTGLDNLLKRYEFLTKMKISIDANAEEFIVRIPLLT